MAWIPLATREIVMENWKERDLLGEGIHVGIGTSVDHPDAPHSEGWFKLRGHYDIMSSVLEKNPHGDGIKYT